MATELVEGLAEKRRGTTPPEKNRTDFIHSDSAWAILATSPARERGSRTGRAWQGTAPGRQQDGVPLGDEPPGPGLDGDQRQRPCPPPGQERRRGAEAAPRTKLREARPCAPLPDYSSRGEERSLTEARRFGGRGNDEAWLATTRPFTPSSWKPRRQDKR
jgi:hypothetical protein